MFCIDDRMVRSARNYPVLTAPTPEKDKHVRALYSYKAQRKDELNFEPGLINRKNFSFNFLFFFR